MHRTLGEDYDPDVYGDASNERGYKPADPPGDAATVLPAQSMNSIQEEICNLIEYTGLTLEADADADKAAGWDQLTTAVRRLTNNEYSLNKEAGPIGSTGLVGALAMTLPVSGKYRFILIAQIEIPTVSLSGQFNINIITGVTSLPSIEFAGVSGSATPLKGTILYDDIIDIAPGNEVITVNVNTANNVSGSNLSLYALKLNSSHIDQGW